MLRSFLRTFGRLILVGITVSALASGAAAAQEKKPKKKKSKPSTDHAAKVETKKEDKPSKNQTDGDKKDKKDTENKEKQNHQKDSAGQTSNDSEQPAAGKENTDKTNTAAQGEGAKAKAHHDDGSAHHEPQPLSDGQLNQAGSILQGALRSPNKAAIQSALKLLNGANYDYDGHRAAAVSHLERALKNPNDVGNIKAAIAEIGRGLDVTRPKGVIVVHGNKSDANSEPQALSDGQLGEARRILQGALRSPNPAAVQSALSLLNRANHNYHGHKAAAANHLKHALKNPIDAGMDIGAAIVEIGKAMEVR